MDNIHRLNIKGNKRYLNGYGEKKTLPVLVVTKISNFHSLSANQVCNKTNGISKQLRHLYKPPLQKNYDHIEHWGTHTFFFMQQIWCKWHHIYKFQIAQSLKKTVMSSFSCCFWEACTVYILTSCCPALLVLTQEAQDWHCSPSAPGSPEAAGTTPWHVSPSLF